ncbi:MAG: ATP-binding cassette domain-containing protein [Acidobacteria bacterium]|nr:ATP-binding cassette domain-containing protein [Acidobacteriota bacterium]
MNRAARDRRRWLAPEVVQTSPMDCGPAVLGSFLAGHGITASYGRLREACQTDVDGTSVDTVEEVAVQLGLDARQVVRPADHLLLPGSPLLPAVAVVRRAQEGLHFVLVWRRHGPWFQVMDPAQGRCFIPVRRFLSQLHTHSLEVAAGAWREWAGRGEMRDALEQQLASLGLGHRSAATLLDHALADPDWRELATLDAAVRMSRTLLETGALGRGRDAERLLRASLERAGREPEQAQRIIPVPFWSVSPLAGGASAAEPGGTDEVLEMRGAVLVHARGRLVERVEPSPKALSASSLEAVTQPEPSTARRLLDWLADEGHLRPALVAAAFAAAGVAAAAEALVLRGFLDLAGGLGVSSQRWAALGALFLLLLALLGIELPTALAALRAGRRLETRLRLAFLRKIPLLGDRFFASRPISDMGERGHSVHAVRAIPEVAGRCLKSAAEAAVLGAGLVWLDPGQGWLTALLALVSLGGPLLALGWLVERDLTVRTHQGALGRFYLDALLGAVPIRSHGAGGAVSRLQEELLTELGRADRSLLTASTLAQGGVSVLAHGLAAALVLGHWAGGGGAVLLLAYWALRLPALGQQLGQGLQQLAGLRNAADRLFEPLGAAEEETTESPPAAPHHEPGLAVELRGVAVRAAGHTLLDGIDLSVAPGEHLAILGASGAGKSTLLGVLLGWHRPYRGELRIDGEEVASPASLRRQIAWIDPEIRLWNRSLLDNLRYGADDEAGAAPSLAEVLRRADLHGVLEHLPEGLTTRLGEGGARLSGGEGQRVRLGRALARRDARLVLLDEALRGLDAPKRRRLLAEVRTWWRGATLLAVTHDVADSRDFDRVAIVEAGRLVEIGTPAELAAREDSHYVRLLDERRDLETDLDAAGWRRLELAHGRLAELPEVAP